MMARLKSGAIAAAAAAVLLTAACAEEAGFYAQPRGLLGIATASNIQVQDLSGPNLTFEEEREVERLSAAFRDSVSDLVYFSFNESALGPDARAALDAQAAWLLENRDAAVRIYGHTDLVGADPYNDALGLRRARAAAAYLAAQGVAGGRIQSVSSLGESDPVIVTPDPERRNRRTLTVVVGLASVGGPMRVSRAFDGKRGAQVYRRYATDNVEPPRADRMTRIGVDVGE